jgi:hypothetical protein
VEQKRLPTLASAEALFAAGLFGSAHLEYLALQHGHPAGSEPEWIEFRLADTLWRDQVSEERPDEETIDAARSALENQRHAQPATPSSSRLAAEIDESLGDLWLERPRKGPSWDYPQRARPYLAAARKWWFENPGEDGRSERFLRIFWLSQKQPESSLPIPEQQGALAVARSDEERAHLHALIATSLSARWTPPVDAVIREYEAGLALGSTKWRQNLLFGFAGFMRYCGQPETRERGRVECRPDNERALALYAELKEDIGRNGSATHWYVDQEIARIQGPIATLWSRGTFLSGQPIVLRLRRRNLTYCDLDLYAVRLPEDLAEEATTTNALRWASTLSLEGREPIRHWSPVVVSGRPFDDVQEDLRLEPLAAGSYVIRLRSDAGDSRWLLVVVPAPDRSTD